MSNSILCAVDLGNTEILNKVLVQAAMLAEPNDAQLDVVTVLPDFGESWVSGFFEEHHHEKAVKEALVRLGEVCEHAVGKERNERIRHLVATGAAYQEILKTAKAAGSDLIVIGTHKPDLQDYLLGPNAARVVRHSKCSVFVVR